MRPLSPGRRLANSSNRSNFSRSCRARNASLYRYCFRPATSMPVACSFAPGLGEIQTSCQAGGIARSRIRSSCSSPPIGRPRALT